MAGKGKLQGGKGGKGVESSKARSSTSARIGLQFPVGRIARFMKKGRYCERIGAGAPVYAAAALEYFASELIELAQGQCQSAKKKQI